MNEELRSFVLEQMLLASAALFDLTEQAERQRSNLELVRLFEDIVGLVRPKCFIEVGAFTADFSVRIKQLLPATRVIAFEANPYNYESIRKDRDFAQLGVDYRHAAVGRTTGAVEFFVMKAWPNGEIRPSVAPDNSLRQRNSEGFQYEKLHVRSISLSDMLSAGEFMSDDFCLWIDAEGTTAEILIGAERILPRVAAIFAEVEDRAHWQNQCSSHEVVTFMADRGFYPIARDYEYDSQYNIVFLQQRYIRHCDYGARYARYISASGTRRLRQAGAAGP